MRTTVEMKPEHRSALLALAARRGQKGFSEVLSEAVEQFISGERERRKKREALLSLAGSLRPKEIAALRHSAEELRKSWR